MQIDVVSDTICPWCFVGKRKLDRALAMRPDVPFDVHWRAYRLDPRIPAGGVERKAYLKARFGDNPRSQAIADAIRQAGSSANIEFAFDKIEKTPNTTNSHRLIRWAGGAGRQTDIVERLFAAYFENGIDIGSVDALAGIAEQGGMDAEVVRELLSGDADLDVVEREDQLAHQMGISGVPTFIFENKYLLSGAQEPETIIKVVDRVLEISAAG